MILTKRQKQLLDYLETYLRENGYAPTLEEIGAEFNLASLATVHKHLTNLENKGLIRRTWNHSRAIELTAPSRATGAVALPLLGRVAAGQPIEEVTDADTISVPEEFLRRGKTFVLRVVGSSMVEDGIWDGDYIVVEERASADSGETVVATVNDEVTVKRFYPESDGKVRLQPANDAFEPIVVSGDEVEIRGVVIAVMRKY